MTTRTQTLATLGLVVSGVLALLLGAVLGSFASDATAQDITVSCNALKNFWKEAHEIVVDDDQETVTFIWDGPDRAGSRSSGQGKGQGADTANGHGPHIQVTVRAGERGCNQEDLDQFLDLVEEQSAAIKDSDCMLALETWERVRDQPVDQQGRVLLLPETDGEPIRSVLPGKVEEVANECANNGYTLPDGFELRSEEIRIGE